MSALQLFIVQRLTALIMAPLVLAHLAVMAYAIHGGLSVAEILGRTQGSWLWFGFYGLFVVAASSHAAIGLRAVLTEWVGFRGRLGGRLRDLGCAVFGLALFGLGARAVWAVTLANTATAGVGL